MTHSLTHYDVIVAPVITEKATIASELNRMTFKVHRDATKPPDQSGDRGFVQCQGRGRQHAGP